MSNTGQVSLLQFYLALFKHLLSLSSKSMALILLKYAHSSGDSPSVSLHNLKLTGHFYFPNLLFSSLYGTLVCSIFYVGYDGLESTCACTLIWAQCMRLHFIIIIIIIYVAGGILVLVEEVGIGW